MSEAYLGQIEIFAFPFAPKNWQACAGAILSIQQNAALFSLLGTTYGGNGTTTFGLPDLRGRAPISWAQNGSYVIGQKSGEETHQLAIAEIPQHNHMIAVDAASSPSINKNSPANTEILGATGGLTPDKKTLAISLYGTATPLTQLDQRAITTAGSSVPHENRMPTLVLNICICTSGIFPSRN